MLAKVAYIYFICLLMQFSTSIWEKIGINTRKKFLAFLESELLTMKKGSRSGLSLVNLGLKIKNSCQTWQLQVVFDFVRKDLEHNESPMEVDDEEEGLNKDEILSLGQILYMTEHMEQWEKNEMEDFTLLVVLDEFYPCSFRKLSPKIGVLIKPKVNELINKLQKMLNDLVKSRDDSEKKIMCEGLILHLKKIQIQLWYRNNFDVPLKYW